MDAKTPTVAVLLDEIHRGTGHVRTVEQIAYSLGVERRDLLPAVKGARAQGLITAELDTHTRSNLLRLTELGRNHLLPAPDPDDDAPTCRDCGTWPCNRHATAEDIAEYRAADSNPAQ